jgi:hypothetical protein
MFFSKVITVKCPDGKTRRVYKNPEDAFPLRAKDWSAQIKSTLKTLKGFESGLGLDLQKQIAGFFMEIDEINRSIQAEFRALYIVYSANPCELDKWLAQETKKLIERESGFRFREIRKSTQIIETELKKAPRNAAAIKGAIAKARKMLSPTKRAEKTKKELQTALDDFQQWRRT